MDNDYSWDFFVSYVASDKTWGEWIIQVLQSAGYNVVPPDYVQGGKEAFLRALRYSRRLLPLLSPTSIRNTYEETVWQSTCAICPDNRMKKVVPITVVPCEPFGLLAALVPIDLTRVATNKDKAAKHLLTEIEVVITGERRFTSEPPFPG